MAWNEPGGGKDPWGNGGNNGGNRGGNNQGPPDLDEALKQLMEKLNKMFGGKGGGKPDYAQGGAPKSGNSAAVISALPAWIETQLS